MPYCPVPSAAGSDLSRRRLQCVRSLYLAFRPIHLSPLGAHFLENEPELAIFMSKSRSQPATRLLKNDPGPTSTLARADLTHLPAPWSLVALFVLAPTDARYGGIGTYRLSWARVSRTTL